MTDTAYIIRQGDWLERIAYAHGFDDVGPIQNHAPNREYFRAHPDGNQMVPGARLMIPRAPDPTVHSLTVGGTNSFSARVPMSHIRIAVHDIAPDDDATRPIPNERFVVDGAGVPIEGVTDGEGVCAFEVPVHITEVDLTLPRIHSHYHVQIGHLNPINAPDGSGVRQRLAHLGFMHGDYDGDEQSEASVRAAVEAFQRAHAQSHGLSATGQIDDATRDALVEVHGS